MIKKINSLLFLAVFSLMLLGYVCCNSSNGKVNASLNYYNSSEDKFYVWNASSNAYDVYDNINDIPKNNTTSNASKLTPTITSNTNKYTMPIILYQSTTENINTQYIITTTQLSKQKDKTKPIIKGVQNKKTYKKSVTIKFSDKSGIKKATLNGKKIKSGKKIKKNGKYNLVVMDKAGNVKKVKFIIKISKKSKKK